MTNSSHSLFSLTIRWSFLDEFCVCACFFLCVSRDFNWIYFNTHRESRRIDRINKLDRRENRIHILLHFDSYSWDFCHMYKKLVNIGVFCYRGCSTAVAVAMPSKISYESNVCIIHKVMCKWFSRIYTHLQTYIKNIFNFHRVLSTNQLTWKTA